MREISGEAACAMAPILRREAIVGAVFEPNSCDIDTHGLHAGYLRMARARGAEFQLNAGVERIDRGAAGWRVGLVDGRTVAEIGRASCRERV